MHLDETSKDQRKTGRKQGKTKGRNGKIEEERKRKNGSKKESEELRKRRVGRKEASWREGWKGERYGSGNKQNNGRKGN